MANEANGLRTLAQDMSGVIGRHLEHVETVAGQLEEQLEEERQKHAATQRVGAEIAQAAQELEAAHEQLKAEHERLQAAYAELQHGIAVAAAQASES